MTKPKTKLALAKRPRGAPASRLSWRACLLILCALERAERSGTDQEPRETGWLTLEDFEEFARPLASPWWRQSPCCFDELIREIQRDVVELRLPVSQKNGGGHRELLFHWFTQIMMQPPFGPYNLMAAEFTSTFWEHRQRLRAALDARIASQLYAGLN